ncbi:cyclopropane-fatty-acyl-phospholipid synthase [Saccharomonospora amisosensis]|uniref:Cyclopropane-fatty-acyl-phospholipid synthase n=1 Tax=Saccharomonospora amisosensis TaxID=1128677 RepID=A0A7X5UPL1_9PSEU|nr:class I SAM-dependent methyltransferase [Saccharomonospora amisosensis]NIJ11884.1 cyclopropane-fatty-acyl-phospholipid synthase [Saccharomonospora amisosensis]
MTGRMAEAAAAIRHHYDVGTDFFALWLDRSLTYSCAWREGEGDTLDTAQQRKLRYHLDAVGAAEADSVLDIGCGWGSILGALSRDHGVSRAVGLTLSEDQAAYVRSRDYRGVEVHLRGWQEYEPGDRFDGIISIGAFEHFARPGDTSAGKIATYRAFFDRCRSWLRPGGALSLQTIAYANMSRENASTFMQRDVFPDADLPTLAEIAAAADGVFDVCSLHNGRLDYAWTCEQWARRLRERRSQAVRLVGAEVVARYERYLKLSALGFRMGKICLLRLVLRPFPDGYFRTGGHR